MEVSCVICSIIFVGRNFYSCNELSGARNYVIYTVNLHLSGAGAQKPKNRGLLQAFYSAHFSFVPSLERSILVFVSLSYCIASMVKLNLISSIHLAVLESVI